MKEGRSVLRILTCIPTEMRPLGRPWRLWEDNFRIDLKEIGINTKIWDDSTRDRGYWRALCIRVLPQCYLPDYKS